MLVTTTEGEFVLRGAPHWVKDLGDSEYRPEDRWQFTKETWFVRELREQTLTPVPWPFLHEETSDIFGWPFIVMQRTPGFCFNERDILKTLDLDDRRGIAVALGETLAEMHRLTWPFAGDFDTTSIELAPYPEGTNTRRVKAEAHSMMKSAGANGALTNDDIGWVKAAMSRAFAAPERPNTYTHCDYKLNNLTVLKENGTWRVSGLFDFHEARFGDGALDIVRQTCSYLDTEPQLARVFIDAYRADVAEDPSMKMVMPLYVMNDRLKLWEYFTRPGARAGWTQQKTFRTWCERYVAGVLALL